MLKARLTPVLLGTALLALCGCQTARAQRAKGPRPHIVAEASLAPMSGSAVGGKIRFSQDDDSTNVRVELTGVTPGPHALWVHEGSACGTSGSQARSASAGGDLGLARIDSSGKINQSSDDNILYLNGEASIIGQTVVLHTDDDPASAALACGVIVKVTP